MSIIDDIKARVDANGDGKISKEDLESLQAEGENNQIIEKLKEFADQNGDGSISLDDIKSIDLGSVGDTIKEGLGGLFSQK